MLEDNSEHEITYDSEQLLEDQFFESVPRRRYIPEPVPSVAEIFSEGERYELNTFLGSAINEPEDQRIPDGKQQRDYAIKSASMKGLEDAARAASETAIANYLSTHPEAKGLGYRFNGKAYIVKSTPVNYPIVLTRMLDCILDSRAKGISQKVILDLVKQSTSLKDLNANIWHLPLKRYMKALLYKRLNNHGYQISLANCSNMSEVRKTIDTYHAKKQAIHKVKLEVTLTPNEIIISGTTHAITTVNSGTYQYRKIRLLVNKKRTWLNVDELNVLFGLAV